MKQELNTISTVQSLKNGSFADEAGDIMLPLTIYFKDYPCVASVDIEYSMESWKAYSIDHASMAWIYDSYGHDAVFLKVYSDYIHFFQLGMSFFVNSYHVQFGEKFKSISILKLHAHPSHANMRAVFLLAYKMLAEVNEVELTPENLNLAEVEFARVSSAFNW